MNLGDRAFSEKRDFIRMKIDTPLKAQLTGEGIAADGLCHELSGGGMRLETTHSLPPGTEVEVTISTEHGHAPTLRAKTRVTRVHAEHSGYVLGMEIIEILS
jgi:hypothetical protein